MSPSWARFIDPKSLQFRSLWCSACIKFSFFWFHYQLPLTPLHSLWKDASDEVIEIMIQLQSLRFMKGSSWVKVNLCLLIIIVSPSSRKDLRVYTEKSVGLLNIPSHKITCHQDDVLWLLQTKIKSSVKNELNQTLEVELESICAIIATSIKSL